MKVVLFCGGQGTRIRDYSEAVPKPMVPVGYRPILWHLMKYYAHFGHTDFILALGYKADVIKNFFLNYDEAASNDFVLTNSGRSVELMSSDIADWKITFVDTGTNANVGQRLSAVRSHLGDDEIFMANYADGLTDMDLNAHIDDFKAGDAAVKFLAVQAPTSYHIVEVADERLVTGISPMADSDIRINGGFFVLRQEIFDHMNDGEDLIEGPIDRLVKQGRVQAALCESFWAPMDTFKHKQRLDGLFESGEAPWMLWDKDSS